MAATVTILVNSDITIIRRLHHLALCFDLQALHTNSNTLAKEHRRLLQHMQIQIHRLRSDINFCSGVSPLALSTSASLASRRTLRSNCSKRSSSGSQLPIDQILPALTNATLHFFTYGAENARL
jgi:hypothetical protein